LSAFHRDSHLREYFIPKAQLSPWALGLEISFELVPNAGVHMIGARQDQYARRENFVVSESVSEERFAAALSLLCRRRVEESDVARESEAGSGNNIAAQPLVPLPSLRTG